MARTVDLDVLKRELEAEGLEVTSRIAGSIECGGFSVWDDCEVFPPLRLTMVEFAIIDIIRRHVAPAPPVVLTSRDRTELAVAAFRERRERDPELDTAHVLVSDRAELNGIVREVDAVLSWFAANGITLTREVRR